MGQKISKQTATCSEYQEAAANNLRRLSAELRRKLEDNTETRILSEATKAVGGFVAGLATDGTALIVGGAASLVVNYMTSSENEVITKILSEADDELKAVSEHTELLLKRVNRRTSCRKRVDLNHLVQQDIKLGCRKRKRAIREAIAVINRTLAANRVYKGIKQEDVKVWNMDWAMTKGRQLAQSTTDLFSWNQDTAVGDKALGALSLAFDMKNILDTLMKGSGSDVQVAARLDEMADALTS